MRNLKVLGLALVAMLAMTAVVANAASAAGKITTQTGKYPATVTGTQTNENVLSNGIRSVTCKKATLTGTLSEASESLVITPSYSECTANGGIPATVTMNGCDYKLVVTSIAPPPIKGHIVVTCPAGKQIEVDIYASEANHTAGTTLCVLGVGPQTITGVTAVNEGAGTASHVGLTVASSNVNIKRVSGTAANCGVLEQTAGTYNGKIDGTAKNGGGEAVGLLVD